MALFRCFIRGENFPGSLIGQTELIGFYTTRFVEAASPHEAEAQVLELLRNDEDLSTPPTHRNNEAKVFFEEINEVPFETKLTPNKGFTFYVMGT